MSADAAAERRLRWAFGVTLVLRLLYPRFNPPLSHLFSDPARHWDNGRHFLAPTFMGSSDPYLYQLWLFLLGRVAGGSPVIVETATGLLCALMPYGWYRAMKELLPRSWALGGALAIALAPGFLGIYGYFMNETLLLAITGFAFWATFRAHRKRTVMAFVIACTLWLAAGFTRSVALPIALMCLLAVWLPQPQRMPKAAAGLVILLALLVPAGMHARVNLHFLAPFGNPYLNHIYAASGQKDIAIDLGPLGRYFFGCPSFYNPTFYPFSSWTTGRSGTVSIAVDAGEGRSGWLREQQRAERQRTFPRWRILWENLLYAAFGQAWPDNDRSLVTGWLTVWMRWLWPALIVFVAVGAVRRRFVGIEWLLPLSALALAAYLVVQTDGVVEARFRKPLDPIFLAAAVVLAHRSRLRRSSAPGGADLEFVPLEIDDQRIEPAQSVHADQHGGLLRQLPLREDIRVDERK